MKGYNGVAILSRVPMEVHRSSRPTGAARATAGTSPRRSRRRTGRSNCTTSMSPPAATFRTAWRTRNTATSWISSPRPAQWFAARPGLTRSVLVGDLNIAPLEHDVWSHKQLLDVVSHTPPETEGLNAWMNAGFVDAVRHFVPADQKLYTWWSYRNRDWRASDRGPAAGSYMGDAGSGAGTEEPDDPERRPGLAAGVRPRAGLRGDGGLECDRLRLTRTGAATSDVNRPLKQKNQSMIGRGGWIVPAILIEPPSPHRSAPIPPRLPQRRPQVPAESRRIA